MKHNVIYLLAKRKALFATGHKFQITENYLLPNSKV